MESTRHATEQTYVWPALPAAHLQVSALMSGQCKPFAGHGTFGFRGLIVDTDPIRSSPPPG